MSINQLNDMIHLFESANKKFINNNQNLFITRVSERTLCGELMFELRNQLKDTNYSNYYADVEYNRNGSKVKTISKINDGNLEIVPINCDLIVHSRGEIIEQDNLIAIEIKKSTARKKDKLNDKIRLECLTKTVKDVWSYDGKTLPEHVCGYVLGVYYEINYNWRNIKIEYYYLGEMINSYVINYTGM